MPTVADNIVATLRASGVRRIYGIPGDSLNGFTDALRRNADITWEHVRHEEAAAFAASAEAAITGALAVVAGSCGPGNLHLINGLFDANRSRVPVLAIAAHIPRQDIGSGYFQETHPQELFRECSVYCELVSVPEQFPEVLEIAMRTALERRGVAVVVVPGEVFLADSPATWKVRPVLKTESVLRPDDRSLAAAAEALNRSNRVTILAGAGCAGAHSELMQIAAALKAPVVHSLRGKELVEYDNPSDVGMTGLIGFSSGYRAMEHCDALLMLGTDFPYRAFYPEGVPVIQVDIRGDLIGRRVPVEVALVGTVKDTIGALLPLVAEKKDSEHLDRMTAHYGRARARLDSLAADGGGGSPLHPQFVAATIDRLADGNAIFIADVGTPTIWAARYLHMNGKRRLLGSFTHATMANALPQGIGAQASGGEVNESSRIMEETLENVGAGVMGRKMFGPIGGGDWGDGRWKGWWGEDPPYHNDVFILTHYPRAAVKMEGGTTYHFVTDGIARALEMAREAANGKDVRLWGGAQAINQYMAAGLLEVLELHVVPVLLGDGERLFDNLDDAKPQLEQVRAVGAPGVTHLKYRLRPAQ